MAGMAGAVLPIMGAKAADMMAVQAGSLIIQNQTNAHTTKFNFSSSMLKAGQDSATKVADNSGVR